MTQKEKLVKVLKDGPYKVSGNIPLIHEQYIQDKNGVSLDFEEIEKYPLQAEYFLCRCGKSSKRPFCDGTHVKIGFDGTETADNVPYLEAVEEYEGPEASILDCERLCVGARFCDAHRRAWEMVINPKNENELKLATDEANKCPGGRLTIKTKSGKLIEPDLKQEISALDDPALLVRGPLQVRGGISVFSAIGEKYEVRNRVALCRCGFSQNKPFCDGHHLQDKYEGNGL